MMMRTRGKSWSKALAGLALGTAVLSGAVSAAAQPLSAVSALSVATPDAAVGVDTSRTQHVILVTLDGVRWQDIFLGVDPTLAERHHLPASAVVDARTLLPNLYHRMVDGGVGVGAPGRGPGVVSTFSALSLPGYLELLSGRRDSPCKSNRCPRTVTPTLLDQVRTMKGVGRDEVAAISSWELIENAATSRPVSFPMSYGRHYGLTRNLVRVNEAAGHLLDKGESAHAAPGLHDYRPDRFTGPLALQYVKERQPRLMFIGLGDTDEYGHHNDYAGYIQALREADAFLGDLFATLDGMGEYGATTTVVLTTDHGRSEAFFNHGYLTPESRRTWVFAAGGSVPAAGLVTNHRERYIADIAPTIRLWLGVRPDHDKLAGSILTEMLPPSAAGSEHAAPPPAPAPADMPAEALPWAPAPAAPTAPSKEHLRPFSPARPAATLPGASYPRRRWEARWSGMSLSPSARARMTKRVWPAASLPGRGRAKW
jgi:hypothetical protein